MAKTPLQKIAAWLLILMIALASVCGPCGNTCAAEQSNGGHSERACGDLGAVPADDHGPLAPADGHGDIDHDAASCFCACHLPLTEHSVLPGHIPVISQLVSPERFTALPEVYLPRFIPPQNLS